MGPVPGEKPVEVEGELTRREKVKKFCCTRSPLCCCMWFFIVLVLVLVILIISTAAFLDSQAANPPAVAAGPPSNKASQNTKVSTELGFSNSDGLDAFVAGMDDEDSDIFSSIKDSINSLLDSTLEVDSLEASSRRRRQLQDCDSNDPCPVDVEVTVKEKEDSDGDDAAEALNDLPGEINNSDSVSNAWKDTVAAAAQSAVAAAGLNVTVTGEGASAELENVFFHCIVDAPFANEQCGGALNAAVRNSDEVKNAIKEFSADCEFAPEPLFPIAYNGCLDEIIIAATCRARVGQFDFLCGLEDGIDAELGKVRGFAEQYGLRNCAIEADKKSVCWADPEFNLNGGQEQGKCAYTRSRCKKCGTRKVNGATKKHCKTRENKAKKEDFCPWAAGGDCTSGETPAPYKQEDTSPSPSPAPSSGPGGPCFAAEATLTTRDGVKRMDELAVGDEVLVAPSDGGGCGPAYSAVYLEAHELSQEGVLRPFTRLELSSGHALELTGNHLLPADGTYVAAKHVEVGATLSVVGRDGSRSTAVVTGTSVVYREGLFSPLTLHGDIVVDGVVASSYMVYAPTTVPYISALYARHGWLANGVLHTLLAPARLAYAWYPGLLKCFSETAERTEGGNFDVFTFGGPGGMLSAWGSTWACLAHAPAPSLLHRVAGAALTVLNPVWVLVAAINVGASALSTVSGVVISTIAAATAALPSGSKAVGSC